MRFFGVKIVIDLLMGNTGTQNSHLEVASVFRVLFPNGLQGLLAPLAPKTTDFETDYSPHKYQLLGLKRLFFGNKVVINKV